ncbi:BnaC02g26140D [Brassica napus]|uniref:BnaC02g26140D protein n=1 Tax=Brassica napus TaxID=3708 RepID=A0A078H7X6_BRANA|nr:BnaC02g26140D [Brassica napus]
MGKCCALMILLLSFLLLVLQNLQVVSASQQSLRSCPLPKRL